MMRLSFILLGLAAGLTTMAATAQVLAPVGRTLETVGRVTAPVLDPVTQQAGALVGSVQQLAADRIGRLTTLVRQNRDSLELDDRGNPAVRGEVIGVDIDPAGIEAARKAGFTVREVSEIEGLDIRSVRLAAPDGMSLPRALKLVRKAAPGEWSANQLHFESGAAGPTPAGPAPSQSAPSARVGMIDGGVGQHPSLSGPIEQRGFAQGAPTASAHGTAIASLMVGQNGFRGVLPGTPLLAADVYGRDPAGGNALAISRALGWMAARNVRVVTISLVGPANPLLAKVIGAAKGRGMFIVAAVGNDGPAAPPAYPASYPGVIAVTGVDGRNRALVEAGRALHLDYAAPGADMLGAKPGGGTATLRGTSYAAPLVAAKLTAMTSPSTAQLDREAIDLGKRGADRIYGRGLICGDCRTRP